MSSDLYGAGFGSKTEKAFYFKYAVTLWYFTFDVPGILLILYILSNHFLSLPHLLKYPQQKYISHTIIKSLYQKNQQ